jgi:hypothetical protein
MIANRPSEAAINWWCSMAICVNGFFFLDLIFNFTVFGFSYIVNDKKILLLESLLQIMAWVADFKYWLGDY